MKDREAAGSSQPYENKLGHWTVSNCQGNFQQIQDVSAMLSS